MQSWFNGGYRANIVAYALALLSRLCADMNKSFDFMKVWETQDITDVMRDAIEIAAKVAFDSIMSPTAGISNISEWCKKEACWDRLQLKSEELKSLLSTEFLNNLVINNDVIEGLNSIAKVQKLDSDIEVQKRGISIPPITRWLKFMGRWK